MEIDLCANRQETNVGYAGTNRAAPLGLAGFGRTGEAGLRNVRSAQVAPPWDDLGLCLRLG